MASENKQSVNMQQNKNGVVITVYVESPRTRSIKPSEDPTKKTMSHYRMPQTPGSQSSQGYDRRAQLLAYSRQLRENAQSQKNVQVQLPHNQSRPRSKKRLMLAEPIRVCSPSTLMRPTSSTQFGYECVEQHKGSEETNQSNKRKGEGNKYCTILRKLKGMLIKLSCKEIER